MGPDVALQLFSNLLWTAVIISVPLLLLTLLVGVVVSVLQVITQIQDTSLTFIPKVIVAVVGLAAFGPWMLRKTLLYATAVIADIPKYF